MEIEKGLPMTQIRVDIGGDIITAILTDSALEELDVNVGDELDVLINHRRHDCQEIGTNFFQRRDR